MIREVVSIVRYIAARELSPRKPEAGGQRSKTQKKGDFHMKSVKPN
jgi:hypothetical protein